MFKFLFSILICSIISIGNKRIHDDRNQTATKYKVVTRLCIADDKISADWRAALSSRMSAEELDSVSKLKIVISNEEQEWVRLVESKVDQWAAILDSLAVPFQNCRIPDTITIFLGHSGSDDAFTYGLKTVCFDLKAFQNIYGSATTVENSDRISRIFSHEFTHLLHKEWARINRLQLPTFRDSVLWECLYEGFGMYRSLPGKWLPVNAVLPEISKKAMAELVPLFVARINEVQENEQLDEIAKSKIVAHLSRGPVDKKWGAFTVAIWLALDAKGDDKNLAHWIEEGPHAVISLSNKYLPGNYHTH